MLDEFLKIKMPFAQKLGSSFDPVDAHVYLKVTPAVNGLAPGTSRQALGERRGGASRVQRHP